MHGNFRRIVVFVVGGLTWLAVSFGVTNPGLAANLQFLHGHVPKIVSGLQPMGRLPATNRLDLSLGLPLRNQQALDNLLQQISDPASPNFRHYLTPEQFTEQFGPTEQDYQAVIDFAKSNGLTVIGTSPNRMLLNVNGSVTQIEKVFHVRMQIYRHPKENRTFFASDVEPSFDLAVPVLDISGLSDLSRPYPKYVISPQAGTSGPAPKGGVGSGPTGNYIGKDFRATYAPGVSLTGAGQTVALVQFDGYYAIDITNYATLAGLPNVTLTNILLDSFSGVPTTGPNSGNIEVSLDIEMVMSMAPGLSKIILYEGNPANFFPNDVLNRIATDNLASQIGSSWGWNGGEDATTEQIFKQMISQGQTYYNASGDSDAFPPGALDDPSKINEPSSSTNITQVGGTTLLATNPVSETAWNWGGGTGSSGGISTTNLIPYWQTNISMTANHGSTTARNVPDVALTADNIFVKYGNGLNATNVGGTSCAAPLWAGFTALVNQQALANGRPVVGFVNPAIYAIGKGPNYTADFHDVTTGNNFSPSSPTNFPAVAGYDLCTGWGTPNGINLINALAIPDALGILPGTGFSSAGPAGGPFSVTTQNLSLTNSGGTSLSWLLIGVPTWLGVSSTGSTLVAGGSTSVTVSLNSTANSLPIGGYTATLWFSNQTTHIAQPRQFNLTVLAPELVQNGGFEAGNFTSWTFLNTDGFNYVDNGALTSGSVSPHAGSFFAAFGQASGDGLCTISQTLPTVAGTPYLISFWWESVSFFGNPTAPNEFKVTWNGTTQLDRFNTGITGWTNRRFILNATSSSTTLLFGFADDFSYLALDDVSVLPIPPTVFHALSATNNSFQINWNAMTGLVYQVQFKTNLLSTSWVNLGSPITATSSTIITTNTIGPDSQRFYRTVVSPQ